MYKAIGTAEFLSDRVNSFNTNKGLHRIEIIDVQDRDSDNSIKYRISCKFEIYLNKDPACLSIEDYVSKVHPKLNAILKPVLILNTQIYDISYKNISSKRMTDYL